MKYVALIDTLGFRSKLQSLSHSDAKQTIQSFNNEIYKLWEKLGYKHSRDINGRTFSDSLIISTSNIEIKNLKKLLTFLVELYRVSITECDLPLRGGIAVGDFDDIPAKEFDNLQKGIVVGNGFIDAYILESNSGIKGSKITFQQEIKIKIERSIKKYKINEIKKDSNNNPIYELKWADLVFLADGNFTALNKFVDLGCNSKWLDHYYSTLDTFLIGEPPENKKDIYKRIIQRINKQYKYTDLDNFIENFLKSDCSIQLKKSFLGFLRDQF